MMGKLQVFFKDLWYEFNSVMLSGHEFILLFNFINFVAKHGKNYGTVEEYQFRMELFAERDAEINRLNSINNESWRNLQS